MDKRILVVEDDSYTRERVERILREQGYDVVSVSGGEQAVNEVQGNGFNLMILNRFLSGIPGDPTGLEYLEQIKGLRPNIRIILISGSWPPIDKRIDCFVPKPFEREDLIKAVEEIIDIPRWDDCIIDYPRGDIFIQEQIDSIGEEILKYLLAQLYKENKKFTLRYMSQGFSGSMVMNGWTQWTGGASSFVLKVSRNKDEMKKELKAWDSIRISGMPLLNAPGLVIDKIASAPSKGWHAIAYGRIGGINNPASNLRELYKARDDVDEKLGNIFARLSENWYRVHTKNELKYLLWQNKYLYDIKTRTQMLSRLRVLEQYFYQTLANERKAKKYLLMIQEFVENESIDGKGINGFGFDTQLCYIHGDLNSRNVLFTSASKEPIFIDFATFEKSGHIFTDCAKMEADIKFALMDSETSRDIDLRCLPDWVEAEADLLGTAKLDMSPNLPPLGTTEGIQRAYNLIREIIRKEVAGLLPGSWDWVGQYLFALLHHTLKYLVEPNMTDAKQLFAICSAIMICERLKQILPI